MRQQEDGVRQLHTKGYSTSGVALAVGAGSSRT